MGRFVAARSVITRSKGRRLVPEPLPKRLLNVEVLRRRMRVPFAPPTASPHREPPDMSSSRGSRW